MKTIFVPSSKEEMNCYINDVSLKMKGDEQILSEKDFEILWKSNVFSMFFNHSKIFIDDYETTIVENVSDLFLLKKILDDISFVHYKLFAVGQKVLLLVNLAIERESGIFFFF